MNKMYYALVLLFYVLLLGVTGQISYNKKLNELKEPTNVNSTDEKSQINRLIMSILKGADLKGFEETMGEVFRNFNELKHNQIQDVDYVINCVNRNSDTAIIAIHGGDIEKGTSELASTLAALGNYNYYSFLGMKKSRNSMLHITATNFDEPLALNMVKNSRITLSIHGCVGEAKFTYIGGLDTSLCKKIKVSLVKHGFIVFKAPKELMGTNISNIVNKSLVEKGAQLEISRGLRDSFVAEDDDGLKELIEYTDALKEAIGKVRISKKSSR